jgi:hypothetical protein
MHLSGFLYSLSRTYEKAIEGACQVFWQKDMNFAIFFWI